MRSYTKQIPGAASEPLPGPRGALLLGMLASPLLNGLFAVGVIVLATASRPPVHAAGDRPPGAARARSEPPQQEEELELGTPGAPQRVTINWIGHESPYEHAAALSSTDQPDLSRTAVGAPAAASAGGAPPSVPTVAEAQADPTPPVPPDRAMADAQPASSVPIAPPDPVPVPRVPAPAAFVPAEDGAPWARPELPGAGSEQPEFEFTEASETPQPTDAQVPPAQPEPRDPPPPAPSSAPPAEPSEQASPSPTSPAEPSEQATPSPAPPAPAQPSPGPGVPDDRPRQLSDREADATSTRPALEYRNGRITTTDGLEIRTVRPQFSRLTQVIAAPQNPLIEVTFDARGRVKSAKVLVSSGWPSDVDEPVLNAIYAWTARGRAIDDLARRPGGSLRLPIRIMLR